MNMQRTAALVLILPLLLSNLIRPRLAPATAVDTVIAPRSITTTQGSTTGAAAALAAQDQSDSDDNSAAYVLFKTPSKPYIGHLNFVLPTEIRRKRISSAVLQVNFKGPASAEQTWSWTIYNWTTQSWVRLGNSAGTTPDTWNSLSFNISNPAAYVSSNNKIRIRLRSNNATHNAKLDYEALHITYEPVPTPTSTATRLPTRTPTPTQTPGPTPACATHNNAFECQVLDLLNAERTERGLQPLVSNALLHNAARAHSNDMAQNNFFSHTGLNGSSFSQRITAAGYNWSAAAENIAAGYSTPAQVVEGWMNSTGHKNNILNPNYVHIGIGYVYRSTADWDHYWTTDFGKPR